MSIQEYFDQLHSLVEELNNYFSDGDYFPVELVYQDYTFYIKAFGRIVCNCDNIPTEDIDHVVSNESYTKIYKMLAPSFNEMLDELSKELIHNPIEDIPEIIEDFKL